MSSSKYNRVPLEDEQNHRNKKQRFALSPRTIVLIVLVVVVIFVYTIMRTPTKHTYSVVIDAGSTGSRIHVYEFEKGADGVKVVDELFSALKPGLSSYDADSAAATQSLVPLIKKALDKVPTGQQKTTPIALGATAGLRMLGDEKANAILTAVQNYIRDQTPFVLEKSSDVRVLGGNDEGKFAWVAVNLLLGQMGLAADDTSPICDLGGGSVQCMFARSNPKMRTSQHPELEGYLETVSVQDKTYSLYVHSYLGYGMMAGRFKVLKSNSQNAYNCMPADYTGDFTYNGETVSAAGGGGANFDSCVQAVSTVLHVDKPCEIDGDCGFDGAWGGGLREFLKKSNAKPHFLSYIYDRLKLIKAGNFQSGTVGGKATLKKLQNVATGVCKLSAKELLSQIESEGDPTFSHEVHIERENIPFLCLDLSYIFGLLRDGIGIPLEHPFDMDKKITSDGKLYEAAWTLGMALEIM